MRTAIGFDQKRGDQVEVVNLRFADTPAVPAGEPAGWMSYFQFTKDDIVYGAELGVMMLLGLIVLLTVVRPLVRRIITPDGAELLRNAAAVGGAAVAGAIGVAAPGVAINADGTPVTIEAQAAASRLAAALTFRSSAATSRSTSPTAPPT